MLRFYFLLLFSGCCQMLYAQFIEKAPEGNNVLIEAAARQHAQPGVVSLRGSASLDLPFFDDFSYDGPYPSANNWLDSFTFVNTTLALDPPSVGVATFDGLNTGGRPYGGGFGKADTLTSAMINLAGYNAGDNLYLSFWLQKKGLGDKPEESDAMLLEYKNSEGSWVNIETFPGVSSGVGTDTIPPFEFSAFKIDQTAYLYDGFQFRFINQSGRNGAIDLWHLDYVKLEANGNAENSAEDIAFTEVPTSALKNYRAMPRKQFVGFEDAELTDTFSVAVRSHFSEMQTLDDASVGFNELVDAVAVPDFDFLTGDDAQFAAMELKKFSFLNPQRNTYLVAAESNFVNPDSSIIVQTYSLKENNQTPLVLQNDTVSNTTYILDYYAYDDGTSESNIIAQNIGTEIAVKFKANVADSLRAVQFHFPHVGTNISTQLFNFKVYIGQLDEEPEFEAVFQKPFYTDLAFDTLQGFSTYNLFVDGTIIPSPLLIPPGDFYISWQQVTGTEIPIGLDKNNPDGVKNAFFSTTSGLNWEAFPTSFKGAVMMRPLFSKETPEDTAVTPTKDIAPLSEWMTIFPNPASDNLYFTLKNANYADFEIVLYNAIGQLQIQQPLSSNLAVGQMGKGLYILKIRNKLSNEIRTQKIVID